MEKKTTKVKSYLWICPDPKYAEDNEKAIKMLREKDIEFEIIAIKNPDGDTHLPAFFPNKEGKAPASSLAEIYAYVKGYC